MPSYVTSKLHPAGTILTREARSRPVSIKVKKVRKFLQKDEY